MHFVRSPCSPSSGSSGFLFVPSAVPSAWNLFCPQAPSLPSGLSPQRASLTTFSFSVHHLVLYFSLCPYSSLMRYPFIWILCHLPLLERLPEGRDVHPSCLVHSCGPTL